MEKPHGKATRYSCSKYSSILQVLGVSTCNDNEEIHPPAFCNSCYLTAKRSGTRRVVEWQLHNEAYCHICDDMSKGGRPKKSSSGGRPSHLNSFTVSNALMRWGVVFCKWQQRINAFGAIFGFKKYQNDRHWHYIISTDCYTC